MTATSENTSRGSTTLGIGADGWQAEIIAAFQSRREGGIVGYDPVTISVDDEYLRYFDRVLKELSASDSRLPHPRSPRTTLLRSAAAEVMLSTFIEGRQGERQSTNGCSDLAAAMTGDLGGVLLDGLRRRLEPPRGYGQTEIALLLTAETSTVLDDELRCLANAYLLEDDRAWYLQAGFNDWRSSFVEASLVAWMLLNDLVAEEAVPAREALSLTATGTNAASRALARARCAFGGRRVV